MPLSDRLYLDECWDGALGRIYLQSNLERQGKLISSEEQGLVAECDSSFSSGFEGIGPTLDDVDRELNQAYYKLALYQMFP
jgi:hypothetical protein